MTESNWQSLQQSADRARKSADHEKAVGLYPPGTGTARHSLGGRC